MYLHCAVLYNKGEHMVRISLHFVQKTLRQVKSDTVLGECPDN